MIVSDPLPPLFFLQMPSRSISTRMIWWFSRRCVPGSVTARAFPGGISRLPTAHSITMSPATRLAGSLPCKNRPFPRCVSFG